MPRIIKYHNVNISEDILKIDVPSMGAFNNKDDEPEYDEEFAAEQPADLLRNAEERAAEIVAEAKQEADEIIAESKEKAQREREAIFEEAKREGYEEGYAEAEREGQQIVGMAEKTLAEAIEEKERVLRETEPEIVSLIIDIIDKLTGGIVKSNPGIILSIVKAGLWGAPAAKELSVRVSADDFETASKMKEEILFFVDSDTELALIKDTSLEQGQCVIDTPVGSVESSIGTQWNALKNDLIQILKAGTYGS